jgi:uncharacterized protein YggE
MEEFKKEVKLNAIKAAKEKAEYLTKAVNQNIGRSIFIQEVDGYDMNANTSYMYEARSYASDSKEVDIDFEKIKLEYSILVRFELK